MWKRRSFARAIAIATLAGSAALGTASLAGAAPYSAEDQRFLGVLDSHGIEYTSPDDVIPIGHQICYDLNVGVDGTVEYYKLIQTYPEIGADGVKWLMYGAVLGYCQHQLTLSDLPL